MRRLTCVAAASAALLAGCGAAPKPARPPGPDTKLIVVLIGGNSEAAHHGGIWGLYGGHAEASSKPLIQSLRARSGLEDREMSTYYFSWTGDDETARDDLLPGHWNWIFGGAARIAASLREVLATRPASSQLAVIGWSNGGATAYELTCMLGAQRGVDMLVTLDPVAWTTRSCPVYSEASLATPGRWINVYTRSNPANRLHASNVIAFVGRAWNNNHLPTVPTESHLLADADHGNAADMWQLRVLPSRTFLDWASSLKR